MSVYFIAKRSLQLACVFSVLGCGAAVAQSASGSGAVLPWHYTADGGREAGWSPSDANVQHLARAPLPDNHGLNAFAQAPAPVHHRHAKLAIAAH